MWIWMIMAFFITAMASLSLPVRDDKLVQDVIRAEGQVFGMYLQNEAAINYATSSIDGSGNPLYNYTDNVNKILYNDIINKTYNYTSRNSNPSHYEIGNYYSGIYCFNPSTEEGNDTSVLTTCTKSTMNFVLTFGSAPPEYLSKLNNPLFVVRKALERRRGSADFSGYVKVLDVAPAPLEGQIAQGSKYRLMMLDRSDIGYIYVPPGATELQKVGSPMLSDGNQIMFIKENDLVMMKIITGSGNDLPPPH